MSISVRPAVCARALAASVASVAFIACALVATSCEPPPGCDVDGERVAVGDTFPAPDGCNQCVCSEDGTGACTEVACAVDDAGSEPDLDAGVPDAGFPGDNVVVPIPAESCVVVDIAGAPLTELRPLQAFWVDGSGHPAPTAGQDVTRIRWSLVRAPAGSRAAPTATEGLQVGLAVNSAPGVDLGGAYVMQATVVDAAGAEAVHACAFQVRPQGIVIQLAWDTPTGDMDLHLLRKEGDGRFCATGTRGVGLGPLAEECGNDSTGDCNYASCRTDNGTLDWDGDGTTTSGGDPRLVIDDIAGFGPEIIEIDEPSVGEYLVAAFYFSGSVDTGVSVRMYVDGVLRVDSFRLLRDDDWFEVATLRVLADGQACVADPAALESEVCLPRCMDDACAQCTGAACGPNVACEDSTCGAAVGACTGDLECGALVCIPATDACAPAECLDVCPDVRASCDDQTRQCILGPPRCPDEDTDEPNDDAAQARAIPFGVEQTGTLCRGDVDVVSFPVQAGRGYRVQAQLADGVGSFELIDVDGERIAATPSADFYAYTARDESGTWTLRISNTLVDRDQWLWTITVTELSDAAPLSCAEELAGGLEPNASIAAAVPLVVGVTRTASLCDDGDQDFYAIDIPADHRLRIDFTRSTDGTLRITPLNASGGVIAGGNQTSAPSGSIFSAAGPATGYVRVTRVSVQNGARLGYTLTAVLDDLPDAGFVEDAGTTMDAGVADGGVANDGGATTDAGAATDAGVVVDAGADGGA